VFELVLFIAIKNFFYMSHWAIHLPWLRLSKLYVNSLPYIKEVKCKIVVIVILTGILCESQPNKEVL
jgi:hypothetical protein